MYFGPSLSDSYVRPILFPIPLWPIKQRLPRCLNGDLETYHTCFRPMYPWLRQEADQTSSSSCIENLQILFPPLVNAYLLRVVLPDAKLRKDMPVSNSPDSSSSAVITEAQSHSPASTLRFQRVAAGAYQKDFGSLNSSVGETPRDSIWMLYFI
ncbi:hypothetical protein VTK26DRAFT_7368 [Humicola hyalothermophila]